MNKMDDITLTHLFSFLFVFCFDKHLIKVSYRRKQRKEKRSKGKSIKRRRLFIYVLFSFFVKLTFSFLINKRYLYLLHVISTSARKYFILMNWKTFIVEYFWSTYVTASSLRHTSTTTLISIFCSKRNRVKRAWHLT